MRHDIVSAAADKPFFSSDMAAILRLQIPMRFLLAENWFLLVKPLWLLGLQLVVVALIAKP